jgi:hypothetical protein
MLPGGECFHILGVEQGAECGAVFSQKVLRGVPEHTGHTTVDIDNLTTGQIIEIQDIRDGIGEAGE